MDEKIKTISPRTTFGQFFLRCWLWNIILSLLLLIMLPLLFGTVVLTANSESNYGALGYSVFWIAIGQFGLLVIFMLVKLIRQYWIQASVLFIHAILVGILAYYLWGMYALLIMT
jgi:hypothetical protein